jgi:hypothetical protein
MTEGLYENLALDIYIMLLEDRIACFESLFSGEKVLSGRMLNCPH